MTNNGNNKRLIFLPGVLLGLSIMMFTMGVTFPILATKRQIFGILIDYEKVRLFDSIRYFYEENEIILALVILFFTFIFPVFKYLELLNRIFGLIPVNNRKIQKSLESLDKWSMLDVFIVALLILNYKIDSRIIVMEIKVGTTFFASSIILRMICSRLLIFKK